MSTYKELKTPYKSLSLIGAGAGSGKTFHIQKTITEWIEQGHIQADRILAVTFTNAAASEMRERIRLALMSKGLIEQASLVRNAQISTIHGFGLSLIERFSYEQGLSPAPRQLTESEQDVLVRLSLGDVSIIETILDNLKQWGYKGDYKGGDYITAVDQLRGDILGVIHKLRILSLEANDQTAQILIHKAESFLKHIYQEQPFKEETLNNALWQAIQVVTNIYTQEELKEEWGSNKQVKAFVDMIFDATEEGIANDWSLWVTMQSIETAPKIFKKKNGDFTHEYSQLAFDIWEAADKLTVHPGPLRQAIEHITILIKSAIEVLVEYQALKAKSSLVDFGDMVNTAEHLLKQDDWLEEIKQQYDCIIIDEFQDTNPLQFSLLWKVQQAGIPALVVGDIKQSIMGFQGADVRLFSSLLAENKNETEELLYNWRSSNPVMAFINALGPELYGETYQILTPMAKLNSSLEPLHIIDFNENQWTNANRDSKDKYSFVQHSDGVIAEQVHALLETGKTVIDKQSKQSRPIRPNDIAFLANSHNKLTRFAEALRKLGINSQVQQQGWFSSSLVNYTFDALSFLADPSDQYAQMCIKVLHKKEANLQQALIDFIGQKSPKNVSSNTVEALYVLAKKLKFVSVKQSVVSCIETLGLFDYCVSSPAGEQERANVLKLIALAEQFETTQPETLEAQGVFGRSLSSFLLWLNINSDEFDTQPNVDSNNQNAVVLSTWHASKGLEWPVVIVGQLEREFIPSLPNTAVAYELDETNGSAVTSMLENAYAQIIPNFVDPTQKERFESQLLPSEQNTLKNLCYVAMTRAREQLILPWFDAGKSNNMLSFLRELDLDNIEGLDIKRTNAVVGGCEYIETNGGAHQAEAQKPYGRIAISQQEMPEGKLARLSPSTIAEKSSKVVEDVLSQFTQKQTITISQPVDLNDVRKKYPANIVGSWVHYSYQVLLANSKLEERLYMKLDKLAAYPKTFQALSQQIAAFKDTLEHELGAISFQQEVPILAKTIEGATVSGIIDCLVEVPSGYIIIDHKTDEDCSNKAFNHHVKQLAAYAKFLQLNKPVIGVGVNWVRESSLDILSIKRS